MIPDRPLAPLTFHDSPVRASLVFVVHRVRQSPDLNHFSSFYNLLSHWPQQDAAEPGFVNSGVNNNAPLSSRQTGQLIGTLAAPLTELTNKNWLQQRYIASFRRGNKKCIYPFLCMCFTLESQYSGSYNQFSTALC